MDKYFKDLTEEDVEHLPLPAGWIYSMRIIEGKDALKEQGRYFKNVKTGLESEEHPFIIQALNLARKSELPVGWAVAEYTLVSGAKEYFYRNAELDISMWDPPSLRFHLCEILLTNGFDPFEMGIVPKAVLNEISSPRQRRGLSSSKESVERYEPQTPIIEEPGGMENQFQTYFSVIPADEEKSDHRMHDSNARSMRVEELAEEAAYEYDEQMHQDDYFDDEQEAQSVGQSIASRSVNTRNWEGLLSTYTDRTVMFADKVSHRITSSRPALTPSGVRILQLDVVGANERIHQLILKLRSMLSEKAGVQCSYYYHEVDPTSPRRRNNVTLASDIVTMLRQEPSFVVHAMAAANQPGTSSMLQIAFIALHRLLHPLSTDGSMTTALLLQGLNYQLDEMTQVEHIFSTASSKLIISRALLIGDPEVALHWDPLQVPMPMVPNEGSETVLCCLLRAFSIRRDITAYYRTIWRPVFPAIWELFNSAEITGSYVFKNLIFLANRLLEYALTEKSVFAFPSTTTTMCRAFHEIGGPPTMHAYLINIMILPNLMKILAGDHESIENEDLYRLGNIHDLVDKYFDSSIWSPEPAASPAQPRPASFDPLPALLWAVWRLYAHAVYMEDLPLAVLTTKQFVGGALSVDTSGVPDVKLRNVIQRLRRKIERGTTYLIHMPVDVRGAEYMGLEADSASNYQTYLHDTEHIEHNKEAAKLWEQRMQFLDFKPNEMLNLTVASSYELGSLFTEVGVSLEGSHDSYDAKLYNAVSEYLHATTALDESDRSEELLQLVFLYSGTFPPAEELESFQSHRDLRNRYGQLVRGLKLLNRYEDTLIRMIQRVESNQDCEFHELIDRTHNNWDREPEFSARYAEEKVKIAEQHTAESIQRAKTSRFGLKEPLRMEKFPTTSKDTSPHPGTKSMRALQEDFFKSYRFGTSSSAAGVGTSMGRKLVLPPRISNHAEGETAHAYTVRGHSQYTRVEIDPQSNLLAPTESLRNYYNPQRVTPHMIQEKFLHSMRGHQVIPTDEFLRKRSKKKRRVIGSRSGSPSRSVGGQSTASTRFNQSQAPRPFPEHLRHRVRGMDGADPQFGSYDSGTTSENNSAPSPRKGRGRGGRYEESTAMGRAALSNDDVADIIREYKAVFAAGGAPGESTGEDASFSSSRRKARSRSRSAERRKRAGDTSVDGSVSYMAPTQALLYKREDRKVVSDAFLHDIARGVPPNLREHGPSTTGISQPPFVPVRERVYASTGARIPQVPEFLSDSSRGGSRASSRAGSRSSSRSNSRCNSPNLSRSKRINTADEAKSVGQYFSSLQQQFPESSQEEDAAATPRRPALVQEENNGEEFLRLKQSQSPMHISKQPSARLEKKGSHVSVTPEKTKQSPPTTSTRISPPASTAPKQSQRPHPFEDRKLPRTTSLEIKLAVRENPQKGPLLRAQSQLPPRTAEFETSSSSPSYRRSTITLPESGRADPVVVTVVSTNPPRRALSLHVLPDSDSNSVPAPASTGRSQMSTSDVLPEMRSAPSTARNRAASDSLEYSAPRSGSSVVDMKQPSVASLSRKTSATAAPNSEVKELTSSLSRMTSIRCAATVDAQPLENARPTSQRQLQHPVPSTKSMEPKREAPPAAAVSKTSKPFDGVAGDMQNQPSTATDERRPGKAGTERRDSTYSMRFDAGELDESDEEFIAYNAKQDRERAEQQVLEELRRKREADLEESMDDAELRHLKQTEEATRNTPKVFNFNGVGNEAATPTAAPKDGRVPIIKRKSHIPDKVDALQYFIDGFVATKHGRTGSPKPKTIIFKEDEGVIEWQPVAGKRGLSSFFSFNRAAETAKVSHIGISAITEVRRGVQTEVLSKAGLLDPSCCLSIVTADRSLDLTFSTAAERDMAIRGLQAILERSPNMVKFL